MPGELIIGESKMRHENLCFSTKRDLKKLIDILSYHKITIGIKDLTESSIAQEYP